MTLVEKINALAKRLMATTAFHPDAHTVLEAGIVLLRMQEELDTVRQSAKEQVANLHVALAAAGGDEADAEPFAWAVHDKITHEVIDLSLIEPSEDDVYGTPLYSRESADATENPLIRYIDALFVSGNDKPVTSTLFSAASWEVIKECLRDGLPLLYHVVEAECVYRRKLAAYGEETRATSPLKALRERASYVGESDAKG